MRAQGKIKLGFFPLPIAEAERLRSILAFPKQLSALDPCVGDGVAFLKLLEHAGAHRYGIEIDSCRAEQARDLGIETLQANAMDVRCPAESLSLLYMNPPYDFEAGQSGNQRLELVFLEHTHRWLKPAGLLIFVIPQLRLQPCARLLAEHFTGLRIYRLTDPACVQYHQIVVLAVRRKRQDKLRDTALNDATKYLEDLSQRRELEILGDNPGFCYELPSSESVILTNTGIPLDEVEDLLPASSAYRQVSRVLLREPGSVRGRPLTPLHGGHVGLLCTAGMLNGVFGEGESLHIANWRSVKFTSHWEEEEEDGTKILHDRERFSHELTVIYANGKTQILTHENKNPS
jgi:hypothetical protein